MLDSGGGELVGHLCVELLLLQTLAPDESTADVILYIQIGQSAINYCASLRASRRNSFDRRWIPVFPGSS